MEDHRCKRLGNICMASLYILSRSQLVAWKVYFLLYVLYLKQILPANEGEPMVIIHLRLTQIALEEKILSIEK